MGVINVANSETSILLVDKLMNHLDVINMAWGKEVPPLHDGCHGHHRIDSNLLNNCYANIMNILGLKLETFKGNLNKIAKCNPSLRLLFVMTEFKFEFKFSQPGPIDGVKSKYKVPTTISKCTFAQPVWWR